MKKVVLTIAGSDSMGGAGIQADLKTFQAHDVYGNSAITVLTAQNTMGVDAIYPVEPSFLESQIRTILKDVHVDAIKIGMLYSKEIIEVVKNIIKELNIPIVLDPVFISKAGSKLLEEDAIESLKSLFRYVDIITPNRFEAEQLFGYKFGDTQSLEGIINAPCAVVIKNEQLDLEKITLSIDTLYQQRSKRVFQTPYIETNNTHGTGCTYSSAITANLAQGKSLEIAIYEAKLYVYKAITSAPNIGNGKGVINHHTRYAYA
jgi:hydroxymethylpyrimidine/phosphomethylpyrimidine kinase